MSFELKENKENKNYLIAKLEQNDEEYYFIHNKEDGNNYFNAEVLAEMFDVSIKNIRYHNKQIEEKISKDRNPILTLKLSHSAKPVKFYGFSVVRYLASRINTEKAFAMCEWIDDALNEKYNQERGFTKEIRANTINKEQLKKGIRRKNRVIQKLYTCYNTLKEIEHDKSANMVYHDIKQESSEVDTLKDTFILLEKSEQILKSKQPTTQSQLVEDMNL